MVHTGLIQTTEEINGQAYSKCRTVPININLISSHSLLKLTDLEFERTIKLTNQQFCGNMIMIIHCIIYHDTGYINLGFVFWQPSNQFRSQTVGSDAQNRQLHGNHGNRLNKHACAENHGGACGAIIFSGQHHGAVSFTTFTVSHWKRNLGFYQKFHNKCRMSATEEDTELRDLLIQNLENSGVLNKIKVTTVSNVDICCCYLLTLNLHLSVFMLSVSYYSRHMHYNRIPCCMTVYAK